jgi:hypothetical protein
MVRRWWRVVVYGPMGSLFRDDATSREMALRIADAERSAGWPDPSVIEFTERRGQRTEMEYVRA